MDSAIIPTCDIHLEKVAQALCHYHKQLLCLTCVLENERSPECSFTEIGKISGEKDTLLLKCLSVRQTAARKVRLIEKHETKTSNLKDKLKQEVTELHDKLTKRLNEMKESYLKQIDEDAKSITSAKEQSNNELCTMETAINDHIEKLAAESGKNENEIRTELEKVMKKLREKLPDKVSLPEGAFKRNDRFTELILQSGLSFGSVQMIYPARYATIDDVTDGACDLFSKSSLCLASDEIVYDNEKDISVYTQQEIKPKKIYSPKESTESPPGSDKREQTTQMSIKSDTTSPDGKSDKKWGGIFKLFSSDKKNADQLDNKERGIPTDTTVDKRNRTAAKKGHSESDGKYAERIHQESTFYTSSNIPPKYLINKTVNASGLKQHFTSACKFSKLVNLGNGYIGMLSEIHSSLVLVGTDGQVYSKKTFKEGKHIAAAVGKHEIAVIGDPGLQVTKYKVSDKGFTTTGGFMVNEEITNITGFDYDVVLLKFAVSSSDKVIILDKRGKKLKAVPYVSTNSSATNEIATTYDFSNDCLYILNITDKTLKMFSLEKSETLWKGRFGSHSVMLGSMCLYKENLCIACGDSIAIISTLSGTHIVKYDTHDLLEDCFGICVIDEVLVLSSNSDNFEKSTTLAYISL